MRWTDKLRLRHFYWRRLVPAARRLRARGARLLSLDAPDATAGDSWYVRPPEGAQLFTREPEELASALRQMWTEQGLPELVALVEPIVDLARRIEPREPSVDDISPYIYTLD